MTRKRNMHNSLEINYIPVVSSDRRRRQCNTTVLLLTILVILLFISTLVLTTLLSIERNKSKVVESDVCLTPICVQAASNFLKSINETIDPCENFYQFTCGTWLKNTKISAVDVADSTFKLTQVQLTNNIIDALSSASSMDTDKSHAIINVRRLYTSCIDEDAIEKESMNAILSFINTELGGWPILQGSTWNNSTFNISKQLLKLFEYNHLLIFAIGTIVDDKNSSANLITITQSNLPLITRNRYESESAITIAYRQFIQDIAQALTNDTSMIIDDVNSIFKFEKELSKYHSTNVELLANLNYNIRTTFGNLSRVLNTSFDFVDYLRRAYLLANVSLLDDDIVMIKEINYLRNASLIINNYSKRTLQNYLVWRFISNRINHMPKKFQIIQQKFKKVSDGTSAQLSRTTMCAAYVNTFMGFAISKLYIEKYFDENARNQAIDMIENIRNTFIDIIQQSSWMDPISKSKALEKARVIIEAVGYPDYLSSKNITKFENEYAEYNFNSSLISNDLILLRLNMKKNLLKLREPTDRQKWNLAPTNIEASYTAANNLIIFPAGILQMPAFDKDAPKYLNYGGIGMVIAHEFTHGFDDHGRQYDKDGNKIPWWTNETINNFNERKQCIIDQYNNYTVALKGKEIKMSGTLTQGENIADNGGLKEAFYAYQNWVQQRGIAEKRLPGLEKYSPEQLFFISFGYMWCWKGTDETLYAALQDAHSLRQFRVIGSTSNFVEFDRVFGCKPGQGNSRVNKCTVW